MTRKEQRENRRKEILLVSLDIFIRKGYSGAKIQDIAQSVGMSTGLLFNYFESKEKLYEELIKIGIDLPKTFLENIKNESIEFFQAMASGIINLVTENPHTAKMFVFMMQAQGNEAIPESAKQLLNRPVSADLFVKNIIKGQENGSIREGNPKSLALTFVGAIIGIVEEFALNPDFPIPDSEWIVSILRKKAFPDFLLTRC
jgi:AcrR family transcriptional regulator